MNIVLLPYDRFVIKSTYSPELIRNRLSRRVSEKYISRNLFDDDNSIEDFYGEVQDRYFKLTRIISYKNSILPVITGKIIESENGSDVIITTRHSLPTLVFMVIWFSITIPMAIQYISKLTIGGNSELNAFKELIPFIFGYLLFIVPYKIEVAISKKKLVGILKKC